MMSSNASDNAPMEAPDEDEFDDAGRQISLFVNLDGFEGPIDLLLSLARDQKVDLSKIAILPLADQYLLYIEPVSYTHLTLPTIYSV